MVGIVLISFMERVFKHWEVFKKQLDVALSALGWLTRWGLITRWP